jgi:hypothetical protein
VSELFLIASPVLVAIAGVIYRWLHLRLIRHAYDKGGAKDAVALAEALRGRPGPRQVESGEAPDDKGS